MTAFRDLHIPGKPLLMPNPWDVGSAILLQNLGFEALASTSAGAAFARGRRDGDLNLDDMLAAAAAINDATGVPVSADLENGGGNSPEVAADGVAQAAARGLAGVSIEDFSNNAAAPIYPFELALERVEAAIAAARGGGIVLTARAEGLLNPAPDFNDILRRVEAFAKAGADVVFAPGLRTADQVRAVVRAAGETPVSVLVGSNSAELSVARLADLGVARISVGSGLARLAYGGVIAMMRHLQQTGDFAYPDTTASFSEIETLLDRQC